MKTPEVALTLMIFYKAIVPDRDRCKNEVKRIIGNYL